MGDSWRVAHSGVYPVVETESGMRICSLPYAFNTEQIEANARLIAAAPEMLAALREVERHHVELNALHGRSEGRSHTLTVVCKAIALATGDA